METKLAILLVTHGDVGHALLEVARYILGRDLDNFAAVNVPFMSELHGELEESASAPFAARARLIRDRIESARSQLRHAQAGMLVLTDVVGGTGFNVARRLMRRDEGVIIAGVNLPMVLKAAELETTDPLAAAVALAERSRRAIVCRTPLS